MNPKKPRNKCLNCGTECKRPVDKYCDNKCQMAYQYKSYIERWLDGKESGVTSGNAVVVSEHIRKYLTEKHNNKCELCGWGETNIYTDKVPLEIHHIDGNVINNSSDNLQLLCPNCHSLTSTHGGLNIRNGTGRKYKKILLAPVTQRQSTSMTD